jgi:hypothetical protein
MVDVEEDLINGLTSNGLRGRPSMFQVLRAHQLLSLLVILMINFLTLFQDCLPHLRKPLSHIIILAWKKNVFCLFYSPYWLTKGNLSFIFLGNAIYV